MMMLLSAMDNYQDRSVVATTEYRNASWTNES